MNIYDKLNISLLTLTEVEYFVWYRDFLARKEGRFISDREIAEMIIRDGLYVFDGSEEEAVALVANNVKTWRNRGRWRLRIGIAWLAPTPNRLTPAEKHVVKLRKIDNRNLANIAQTRQILMEEARGCLEIALTKIGAELRRIYNDEGFML